MKKIFIVFSFLILPLSTLFSQEEGDFSIRVEQIVSDKFPFMEAYFSVSSGNGKVEPNLVQGNFTAFVDGKDTAKFDLIPFQFSDEPISYSIILSSNGIMDGEPLSIQKQAISNFFEQISGRENDLISVYTFGEQVIPLFENQKYDETLMDHVNSIEIHDQQPRLTDAVIYVARRLDEIKIKKKVIILLSDGRNIDSQYTKEQAYSVLNDKNIPVYTVGIKVLGGRNLYSLDEMAENTGGRYVFSRVPKEINNSLKTVVDYILLGYKIKFKAEKIKGDDKQHQLHIKLIDKEKVNSVFINFIAYKRLVPWWFKYVVLGVITLGLIVLIFILLIIRKKQRILMGITKRKCPVCKKRMKDDWDECLFCKYIPPKTKKKLNKK